MAREGKNSKGRTTVSVSGGNVCKAVVFTLVLTHDLEQRIAMNNGLSESTGLFNGV